MKILPSHKIGAVLLDLVHEAQQELVLVSPYVNLTYWKQLATALTAARDRGVRIAFYIRHEPSNLVSKEQVEALGIVPHLVPNLHAKLYYHETAGLVTSLNLLGASNSNSIEIGCQFDAAAEVEELRHFVRMHLAPPPAIQPLSEEDKYLASQEFGQVLADYLEEHVDDYAQVEGRASGGSLGIRALRNSFTADIERPGHRLVLRGIVSGSEADRFATHHQRHFTAATLAHEVQRGGKGYYDQVRGTLRQPLSAGTFNALSLLEKKQVLAQVADFLRAVRAFKDDH